MDSNMNDSKHQTSALDLSSSSTHVHGHRNRNRIFSASSSHFLASSCTGNVWHPISTRKSWLPHPATMAYSELISTVAASSNKPPLTVEIPKVPPYTLSRSCDSSTLTSSHSSFTDTEVSPLSNASSACGDTRKNRKVMANDPQYRDRRQKNNEAARKSREKKKRKEEQLQVAYQASTALNEELREQNKQLQEEIDNLKASFRCFIERPNEFYRHIYSTNEQIFRN